MKRINLKEQFKKRMFKQLFEAAPTPNDWSQPPITFEVDDVPVPFTPLTLPIHRPVFNPLLSPRAPKPPSNDPSNPFPGGWTQEQYIEFLRLMAEYQRIIADYNRILQQIADLERQIAENPNSPYIEMWKAKLDRLYRERRYGNYSDEAFEERLQRHFWGPLYDILRLVFGDTWRPSILEFVPERPALPGGEYPGQPGGLQIGDDWIFDPNTGQMWRYETNRNPSGWYPYPQQPGTNPMPYGWGSENYGPGQVQIPDEWMSM